MKKLTGYGGMIMVGSGLLKIGKRGNESDETDVVVRPLRQSTHMF